MQQQPEQISGQVSIANVDRELCFRLREPPGLNDLSDQVCAHQDGIFPKQLLAPGAHDVIDYRNPDSDKNRKETERLEQRPNRCSASRHDDQLAITTQFVQNVQTSNQQSNRRYQRQQAGDCQRRHGQETECILALAGHELELTQCHRDPHDGRQRHENEDQGSGRLPENVAAENSAENDHSPPAPLQLIPIACPQETSHLRVLARHTAWWRKIGPRGANPGSTGLFTAKSHGRRRLAGSNVQLALRQRPTMVA